MKTNTKLFKYVFFLLVFGVFTTTTSCDEETVEPTTCNNGDETILCGSIGNKTLTADIIYTIDGFAYVEDGDVLTIEAGTIIKAKAGDGADASALVVSKGGRLIANGSAPNPIIFTSVSDNIAVGEQASTLSPATDAGKWGGVIILGDAPISASVENGDTETAIEGVPPTFSFARYGGSNAADNSGTLNYVSIRFTGTKLANDDEIQGLTLGGVGNGTSIQNIEIISSLDDGIEIFGGSVNISKALIVYQADDGIDLDQSYSGTVSNSKVVIFNPDEGNDAMEIDGPEGPSNATGLFTITDCTFLNKGNNCRGARMKSGAQGTITNCVFEDFSNWLYVDGGDATSNYTNGTLKVMNSEFDNGTLDGVINASADSESIATMFQAAGNVATTTFTKGSTADFSWTWANTLNLLD